MKRVEFKKQYERLCEVFGEKNKGHAEEWFRCFKDKTAEEFEQLSDTCIREFVPYGTDKWPTPGQFSPMTEEERDRQWAKHDPVYGPNAKRHKS